MSRFLMSDCNFCGEPQVSLAQCPVCGKGYCEESCYYLATIECVCGERVCIEDCIHKCCSEQDRKEEITKWEKKFQVQRI